MSLKVLQNTIAQMANDPEDQHFVSSFARTSLLAPGAKTLTRLRAGDVYAQCGRLGREGNAAREVTTSISADVDRKYRRVRYIRLVETRGQCVTAGCDAPHTWLHADHRTPRAKQGPTSLPNLDPLCSPDNQHKGTGQPLRQREEDD